MNDAETKSFFEQHRYREIVDDWQNREVSGDTAKILGLSLIELEEYQHGAEALQSAWHSIAQDWQTVNTLILSCVKIGDTERALKLCNQAVGFHAGSDLEITRAIVMLKTGDLAQAASILSSHQNQNNPYWLFALSALEIYQKNPAGALKTLQRAVHLKPDYIEAHLNLAQILSKTGHVDGALPSLNQALTLKPWRISAHVLRIKILSISGRLEEALQAGVTGLESCTAAVAIEREFSQVLVQAAAKSGDTEEFIRHFVEHNPACMVAARVLAEVYIQLGKPGEAIATLRRVLELNPADYAALGELLILYAQNGDSENFTAMAAELPENSRHQSTLMLNLSIAYMLLGQFKESIQVADICLQVRETPEALLQAGLAHLKTDNFKTAEEYFKRALGIKPDYAKARLNLSLALFGRAALVDALKEAVTALKLAPNMAECYAQVFNCYSYLATYEDTISYSDKAVELSPRPFEQRQMRLYAFSYHPYLTAPRIFEEFRLWGESQKHLYTDFKFTSTREPDRKIRVGFLSPDFRKHTSRLYFEPLFAHFDRENFELIAYSNVLTPDKHTDNFKQYFSGWRDIAAMPDKKASALIAEDNIDILVDGVNHMAHNRLSLFAMKPAPVQVTWLGSVWTSGLNTMDYAIHDTYTAPFNEGVESVFTEKLIRLPDSLICYRPPEDADIPAISPLPARTNGYITFGYSGRTERLNNEVFKTWGEILRALPDSRLILDFRPFNYQENREYFQHKMAGLGVPVERVTMRYSQKFWPAIAEFDIMLDSFPHSGGTMIMDGLWMGIPLLTLKSRPPVGRLGASMMSNLGLLQWIASSRQELVEKAITLTRDMDALESLRLGMRDRMKASPLMNEQLFTNNFCAALRDIWREYCKVQHEVEGIAA